jgi:soluble lytic murein transglycosylase-like protein
VNRSRSFFIALCASLFLVTPAYGSVPHMVAPGETLWSIAAANNFTTRALAAANGLSEDAQVVEGSTIQIPSEQEAAAALGISGTAAPAGTPAAGAQQAAPPPSGAYTVRPGDTLSQIAANSGVSVGQLAWMNGLDAGAPLLIGTALKLPTGAPLAAEAEAAPVNPTVVPQAAPYATPGRVTAGEIGQVAATHGVPSSLATAVAWQESGFNNGVISSANARGVMQILPGTWTWVQDQLAGRQLDPSSPLENVQAGVMYLRQLLADAGGDESLAVASYYQGGASVRNEGMLPDTQRYVQNVMALRGRFGG